MVPSFPVYEVFISHERHDKASIAIPLRQKLLDEHNIKAFVDEIDIPRGKKAKEAIFLAMENAHVAVIVLSPEFVAKEWPMKELLFFLQRHEEAVDKGVDPDRAVLPFFYRLSVAELYQEPRHRSTDEATQRLYDETRFFQRMKRGEPEANVDTIREALGKLHEFMGIENYIDASNESSFDMTRKREVLLDKLSQTIAPLCPRRRNSNSELAVDPTSYANHASPSASVSAYYPSDRRRHREASSRSLDAAQRPRAPRIALYSIMSVLLVLLLLSLGFSAGRVASWRQWHLFQSSERKEGDVDSPAVSFGDRAKASVGANGASIDTGGTPEQKGDDVGSSTLSVLDLTKYSLGIAKNWTSAYADETIGSLPARKEKVIGLLVVMRAEMIGSLPVLKERVIFLLMVMRDMLWAIEVAGTTFFVGMGLFLMSATGAFIYSPDREEPSRKYAAMVSMVAVVGGSCFLRDLDPPKQIGYSLALFYVLGACYGVLNAFSTNSQRQNTVSMMIGYIFVYNIHILLFCLAVNLLYRSPSLMVWCETAVDVFANKQ